MNKVFFNEFLLKAKLGLNKESEAMISLDYLLKLLPRNINYINYFLKIKGNTIESIKLLDEKYGSKFS